MSRRLVTLPNRLESIMTSRGLSDVELAALVGISEAFMRRLRLQSSNCSVVYALALARALDMPVEEIFTFDGDTLAAVLQRKRPEAVGNSEDQAAASSI